MSGFYISMALSGPYTGTSGTLRFYANRVLRLFPVYLAVLILTALAYAVGLIRFGVPGFNGFNATHALDQITVLPHVIWLHLIGETTSAENTLAIGWYYTVGLEMIFYALAPFFLRWKLPSLILLLVGAGVVHFLPFIFGFPERQWQYEFFPSTAVFFVAGALSYRLYLAIKDDANRYIGWLALPSIIAYGYFYDFEVYTNAFPPIAMYAALTLMLPFLFIASRGSAIDKFLADISYPFYVVHGLGAELTGGGVGKLQANPLPGLMLTIALSIGLIYLVQRPIERLRGEIRDAKGAIPSEALSAQASPAMP